MEISATKKVKANAKTVEVHVKVCDQGNYTIKDQDGAIIADICEDYVPGFFPGEHYGDYLILNIDLDTGVITNWKKPCAADIEKYANKDGEE